MMKKLRNNRMGKFRVSFKFFEDLDVDNDNSVNLFKDLIILQARDDFVEGIVEYTAVSKHFKLVAVGERIPEYAATFTKNSVFPKWKEIK